LVIPTSIPRPHGLNQREPMVTPINFDSALRHVQRIERACGYTSLIDPICETAIGQKRFHVLHQVRTNDFVYVMKDIDLLVVYSVFDSENIESTMSGANRKKDSPKFENRQSAIAFGNLFLLLQIHPFRWFPILFGSPSQTYSQDDVENFVVVQRDKITLFYLRNLQQSGTWHLTPRKSTTTFEYK
jgi:hypothetical protein